MECTRVGGALLERAEGEADADHDETEHLCAHEADLVIVS